MLGSEGSVPDDGVPDDLGGDHEQGVLDEQVVLGGEVVAQGRGQQLRPQLALKDEAGEVPVRSVQRGEFGEVECVGWACRAEPALDLQGCRVDLLRCRQDALEPDHQALDVGACWVDDE